MIKRLLYIFLLLMLPLGPSMAKAIGGGAPTVIPLKYNTVVTFIIDTRDTTKGKKPPPEPDDKKKIKEIAKAKRQAKPEKLSTVPIDSTKVVPQRQRRPDGLVRPPEIPRRNNN